MACKCASNMHIPEGGICRDDEHAEYAGISQTAPGACKPQVTAMPGKLPSAWWRLFADVRSRRSPLGRVMIPEEERRKKFTPQ
jgi:hypothetical protein